MDLIQVFFVAFIVSYVGSIPPGSINITVMQMSVQQQRAAALAFGLGAVLIEFLYASAAVRFLQLLMDNERLFFYLQAVTATGLVALGIYNYLSHQDSLSFTPDKRMKKRNGFFRGIVLGLVNPLTIPFWLGVTTYLQSHGLIWLDGGLFWAYTIGLAIGTYTLLITVDILGSKFQKVADNQFIVHKLPGLIFMVMGVYYFYMIWMRY
jgi:threonine/homoserine/homoserine lactone efflux protein